MYSISLGSIKTFETADEFLSSSILRNRGTTSQDVIGTVNSIFDSVFTSGFDAIRSYTAQFDNFELTKDNLRIAEEQFDSIGEELTSEQKEALDQAYDKIQKVQCIIANEARKTVKLDGIELRSRPIRRVGIYVPGGLAPLPSSLLMAGVTAKAAGVTELFICTPPRKEGINNAILYTAKKLGITEVYCIGGAQAIAAMAIGLPGVMKKADMICGPGNQYVTAAKALAFSRGLVKIDLIAGPSEVLIIAEEDAEPQFVAADMLAQAEHGTTSMVALVTPSRKLAGETREELKRQINAFLRKEAISKAFENFGAVVLVKNIDEAVKIANEVAPEHLEIFSKNSGRILNRITNAGAVFINTGEVFADYGMTGGNHILPTGGTARFLSGLSAYDFMVRTYIEEMTGKEQKEMSKLTAEFADMEGLEAHSNAAKIRGEEK